MTRAQPAHFCVVGHPNKGKSSIVSTLVEDDSVRIGVESGTTTHADTFTFTLDGQALLALTDTPGFQRARQVLDWLQQIEVAPAQRPQRLLEFLQQPEHAARFPDETALLTPIMQGAGILYVTDASAPVSATDLAEMEILRWSGQARMAIINPMSGDTYLQDWQLTLDQYFQWVRRFDPLQSAAEARLHLFRAMAELLQPAPRERLYQLITQLQARDEARVQQVAQQLAGYWCEQMGRRVPLPEQASANSAQLLLFEALNRAEQQLFSGWIKAWGFHHLTFKDESDWLSQHQQLMHTESWSLWGLQPRQLLLVAGAAGAATGALVDASLLGSTGMLGTVTGGVLGSASAWWLSRQSDTKLPSWLPGVKKQRHLGPVNHPNFPFVVMARALSFALALWHRPHARRDTLSMTLQAGEWSREEQVRLLRWQQQLNKGEWSSKQQQALETWVASTLSQHLLADHRD